jgi:hypothetical protein
MAGGPADVRRVARAPSRQLFLRLPVVPMLAPCALSPFLCLLRHLLPHALEPSGAVSISPAFAFPVAPLIISPVCATPARPALASALVPRLAFCPPLFDPLTFDLDRAAMGVHRREWHGDVLQPIWSPCAILFPLWML